jgi:hypothetical protein
MAAKSQRSPYQLEELTVALHRSRLGAFWRWRTEMSVLSGGATGFLECWHCIGPGLSGVAFGGGLALAAALPWTRRFLAARFWCLVTRHRLQRAFWEMRLHTRAGHLPLILWMHGTKVGERVFILARAGTSVSDYEDAADVFAAACGAREARVTASRRWSQLITIDILRRDILTPRKVIRSTLADLAGPVIVPAQRAVPEPAREPVTDSPAWPGIEPGDTRS